MNLYLTTGTTPEGSDYPNWAGSQADASKQRAEMKRLGMKNVGTETVDIPTSKAALLEFLNKNDVVAR